MQRNNRPEDTANREYYANMPTRRARVTVEVDVEWREDDPEYSFSVLNLGELDSIRVRNLEVKDVQWAETPVSRQALRQLESDLANPCRTQEQN